MPYKVGKKTKTKGWPILKNENGRWTVIAHSSTREKAEASVRARHMGTHRHSQVILAHFYPIISYTSIERIFMKRLQLAF